MGAKHSPARAFFRVRPLPSAMSELLERWQPRCRQETLATTAALGRTLAAAPTAPSDLPTFTRSSMDGYAVRAGDTFGASDSLPAYLRRVGRVAMGEVAAQTIARGECVEIATGAMLPPNADAVVMVEHTQTVGTDAIECLRAVAPGETSSKSAKISRAATRCCLRVAACARKISAPCSRSGSWKSPLAGRRACTS